MEDRQSNLPLAESLYQQAVTANPQNAAALNDLGLCLAREGKLEPSLQVLEQAVQLQPDKSLYRNNAATVLVEMRQDQRALAHLAAVHNPAEANFNLGQLLVDRGRPADAATVFPNRTATESRHATGPGRARETCERNQLAIVAAANASRACCAAATVRAGRTELRVRSNQTYSTGPQLRYPATARTPAVGTSSYVPPQYLPPVASQPGRPLQR